MRLFSKNFEKLLSALIGLAFIWIFLILAVPAFQGRVYLYDDLGHSHLPFRYLYANALASGSNFLWTSALHSGFYLHGDGLVGMLHPFHWLIYRALPVAMAFNIEMLSSYPAIFLGMFWMLRRWRIDQPSALLGALIFSFSGFNLMHYMHMNAIAIVAHIPWLIGLADLMSSTKDSKQSAAAYAGISLLTASECLLGYPQYVLFSTIAEVAFIGWTFWGKWNDPRLRWWLSAKALGGIIGLVQILPTWDSMKASVRSNPSLEFSLDESLHPMNFIQFWSPFALRGHVYGDNAHELAVYSGSVCTAALVWPFIRSKQAPWDKLIRASMIFAIAMLICAMGRYGLVYIWIARLPVFGWFRDPARYIVLFHLAISVLAAIMFHELSEYHKKGMLIQWRALLPLAVPATLSILTAIIAIWSLTHRVPPNWPFFLQKSTYSSSLRVIAGTAIFLTAAGLIVMSARGIRWSLIGIVILVSIDAFNWGLDYTVNRWTTDYHNPAPLSISSYLKIIPSPPDLLPGRVSFDVDWFWTNVETMKGYSLTSGYTALSPARILDEKSEIYRRLANVRWVQKVDSRQLSNMNLWAHVPNPMPRARMVARSIPTPIPDKDLSKTDILHVAWTNPAVDLKTGNPGSATIVNDHPGAIDVRVSAPSRQLLILSESYHSGWQATQDGKPIPVLRAYGDFIASPVDAGSHQIKLWFWPSSFLWGLRFSLIGLCLLACTSICLLLRGF